MCDVYDVLVASAGSADVINSTLCEYGERNMGGGIRRLATEMLTVGKQIGYEQGVEEIYPIAFDDGLMAGWGRGFETGRLEGLLKGSLTTLAVTSVLGLTAWGIKKFAEHKKVQTQVISAVEEVTVEQKNEVEQLHEQ